MKKFFKNGVFFLLFFMVSYAIGICLIGEFAPYHFRKSISYKIGGYGFLNSRIKEIDKYKNADILIIGTSHAYRGFDTRIFKKHGIKAFVLGSSAQSSIQTNVILERYLDKINPKLVIYDVNPGILNSDGVEAGLDLISNDYISYDSFQMALKINNIKLYNTLIFSFYKQIFNANKNFIEEKSKNDDTYISGGYVDKKLRFNKEKNNFTSSSYRFYDLQLESLDSNIKLLKQKQVPFVLIHLPINKNRYESINNYKTIDSLMNKKSDRRYYDFNKYINLSDTLDFFDDSHLNSNGVKKFDEFFIQFLKKEKIYPN